MYDWQKLTVEALSQLGADEIMVPGAKLHAQMVKLGYPDGFDVAAHVAASGYSFSKLVERVAGVTVRERPGSDVLVGLSGAQMPDAAPRLRKPKLLYGGLRSDVFQAFTRISKVPFVYLPGSDRFVTSDKAKGPAIEVDRVGLESLIASRRAFAESLHTQDKGPLLDAIENSPSPLEGFRKEIMARGLLGNWSSAQTETITRSVLHWAKQNDLAPRDDWFQRPQVVDSPHRTLERLIPHLTASEIRELQIPFRAIESFLSDLNDR